MRIGSVENPLKYGYADKTLGVILDGVHPLDLILVVRLQRKEATGGKNRNNIALKVERAVTYFYRVIFPSDVCRRHVYIIFF